MWYPAAIVDPPAEEPVSVEWMRSRIRVDSSDGDSVIADLIAEARDYIERYCGLLLAPRTVDMACDGFDDFARLPLSPITAVDRVDYVDADGDPQTLASSVYELVALDAIESRIVPKPGQTWPSRAFGSKITVRATAGFSELPPALRAALALHAGAAHEVRENSKADGRTAVDDLLVNFRRGA